ncbi:DUF3817 domain-containing protein [Rhodococcus sp. X156]|uniref:DUF3817 domain-containing protein n=1 Tax=Rhodococcus sp. X156 TaxID=2499145 RepID=UPI000FD7B3B0|nr:DUF3817 domain-containing protein [Rhodococcus sp. X156]
MTTAKSASTPAHEVSPRVGPALTRYRVLAYVTGVLLVGLVVAMIFKYTVGDAGVTSIIAIAHGWIYVVYLLLALDLAVKARFRPGSAVLVLLAGTIPLMSFVAENKVTNKIRRGERL